MWDDNINSGRDIGVTRTDGGFRFQGNKVLLTYEGYIDKNAYVDWLSYIFCNRDGTPKTIKECHIVHNIGTGELIKIGSGATSETIQTHEHTHICIKWDTMVQTTNQEKLDYNGLHPHWYKIKNDEFWKYACSYISKENRDVSIYQSTSGVLQITKKKSFKEFPERFYKWQYQVYDMISDTKNKGTVNWLYDPVGCTGKTMFGYWLDEVDNVLCIGGGTGPIGLYRYLTCDRRKNWRGKAVIIDLYRSHENEKGFYDVIDYVEDEHFKVRANGDEEVILDQTPCIWVFANWLPQIRMLNEQSLHVWGVERTSSLVMNIEYEDIELKQMSLSEAVDLLSELKIEKKRKKYRKIVETAEYVLLRFKEKNNVDIDLPDVIKLLEDV